MKYQKNNRKWKRSESESKSESSTGGGSRRIKEGDNVEISRLLSSKDRDHLVSCVHGMEVKVRVAELKGNVLAVVFVSLSSKVGELDEVKALARICKELGDRSCAFKVVFIATGDKCHFSEDLEGRFWYFLSYMPWLAIPYTDKESRQRLQRQFGFSNHTLSQTILFDPRGLVLSTNAASCFHSFGAEGYPFTSERILEIYSQEEELAKNPSLERLLVSPIHTCVIKNTREEVPISSLEEKVVCLYLYEDGVTTDELTEKLKYAYLELRQRGKDFELVLVYISSTTSVCDYVNEYSFWERFKTMPWLALPFKDPRCEKVARVFNYPDELGGPDPVPTMVIIGPRGSYVEFYGADILVEYGISAYPFTREQAAKREIEKLRGVTLDSLLDLGVVLGAKDGSQISYSLLWFDGHLNSTILPGFSYFSLVFVSDLAGKRVLLLVAEKLCFKSSKFLDMLKTQYCLQNDKNDGFEVIYLSLSHERSSYDECIREVPWLVHPFCEDPKYADSVLYRMFGIFSMPTISVRALLAFEDGKLLGKASDVGGGVEGYSVFPFVDDLEEHTKAELIMANGWYLQYDDTDAYLEELGFRDIN